MKEVKYVHSHIKSKIVSGTKTCFTLTFRLTKIAGSQTVESNGIYKKMCNFKNRDTSHKSLKEAMKEVRHKRKYTP